MKDPIEYAQKKLIGLIDSVSDMNRELIEINRSQIYLKELIIEYFSDLQSDDTRVGVMRRLQIRKELLEFAHKRV
jgi:hypothetical protein